MAPRRNSYLIVTGGTGRGLLGNQAALNFTHEWQIDVESEKFSDDTAHFSFIPLDTCAGSTAALARHYQGPAAKPNSKHPHASPYLTTRADSQAVKNHSSFYWSNVPDAALKFGLAGEPALGAALARFPNNEQNLRAKLARISEGVDLYRGVEVWIVSSTAGGTGQGIHRYIAALIADILAVGTPTPVHFHFVQIGQETYGSAGNMCTLNTFFGVAADVAFSSLLSEIKRGAYATWYYLELTDVGTGQRAKKLRAELVELSIKTIMNDALSVHLNQLTIHCNSLPFIFARIGFWGKDFDETSKYKQTLNATLAKLNHLLMPAEEMPARAQRLVAETAESDKPKFIETANYSGAIEKVQNSANVTNWLGANNKVPKYPAAVGAPLRPDASSWPPELRARAADLASSWKAAFKTMGRALSNM